MTWNGTMGNHLSRCGACGYLFSTDTLSEICVDCINAQDDGPDPYPDIEPNGLDRIFSFQHFGVPVHTMTTNIK
jgi:hypothetical protein